MDSLKYIFAQPEVFAPINIYPIKLKDYEIFNQTSHLLYISKNHFEENDYPLLLLVFMSMPQLGLSFEELINKFEILFSLSTQKPVKFISNDQVEGFLIDNTVLITSQNYDDIRKIIMKQNIMHEQKIYKNKKVQEWANKAMEARSKNGSNVTLEDIVSTVSVYKGVSYSDMMEYTLYQLYTDFQRIRKMKKYDADIVFRSVSDEVTIDDFAEEINLFHNPYDDLFVSKDKLNKLNKAMGGQK